MRGRSGMLDGAGVGAGAADTCLLLLLGTTPSTKLSALFSLLGLSRTSSPTASFPGVHRRKRVEAILRNKLARLCRSVCKACAGWDLK